MPNQFLQPSSFGPVILETAEGKIVDITTLVKEINLYENIFINVVSADMVVIDTPETRLIQEGLLGSLDKITFSFSGKKVDSSKEEPIKQTLYVYKTETSPPDNNQSAQTIFLTLSPLPLWENNSKDISKSYSGKITDNVKKIAKEVGIGSGPYKIELEPSDDEMQGTYNYRGTFEIINFFAARCRPSRNRNDVNYIFYQTVDDIFKFISVGYLMKQKPKVGSNSKNGFTVNIPNENITNERLKYGALSHSVSLHSPLNNALKGMFTSDLFTFDMTTKTYGETTFSYDVHFPKQTHLSSDKIIDAPKTKDFSKLVQSSFITRYVHKGQYCMSCKEKEEGQDKTGGSDDWLLKRLSCIQQLNQFNIMFTVPGNSEFRAGDVFYFGRPMQQGLSNKKDKKDFLYNGKFLATEVKHSIKYNTGVAIVEYTTTIKGTKDSIGDE
jgi:hypothetical protein